MDYIEGKVGEEVFFKMYREVDCVVDMPACTLVNIILRQFPDSKVIVTMLVLMILMRCQGDSDGQDRQ